MGCSPSARPAQQVHFIFTWLYYISLCRWIHTPVDCLFKSLCLSIYMHTYNNSRMTGWIIMKFDMETSPNSYFLISYISWYQHDKCLKLWGNKVILCNYVVTDTLNFISLLPLSLISSLTVYFSIHYTDTLKNKKCHTHFQKCLKLKEFFYILYGILIGEW